MTPENVSIVERILPSLAVFVMSAIGSAIVTIVTLKVSMKRHAEELKELKDEMKQETHHLHERITTKDKEQNENLREIRADIKLMLQQVSSVAMLPRTFDVIIEMLKDRRSDR